MQNTYSNTCNLCLQHTENQHRLLKKGVLVTIQPDWMLIMFVGSTLIIPAVRYAFTSSDY